MTRIHTNRLKFVSIGAIRGKNLFLKCYIFAKPTRGNIVFADIESLVVALGGDIREGAGSRVVFEIQGKRQYLHRPHPGKEAKKYQVEAVRDFLQSLEVRP